MVNDITKSISMAILIVGYHHFELINIKTVNKWAEQG